MKEKVSSKYQREPMYKYFGFYITLFGLLHLAIGGYSASMKYLPKYIGEIVEATILEKETGKYRRKLISYRITYEFETREGNVYKGKNLVKKPYFLTIKAGDKFDLSYLSFYPSAHFFSGSTSSMMAITMIIMGIIITLIGLIGHTMHMLRLREKWEEKQKEILQL